MFAPIATFRRRRRKGQGEPYFFGDSGGPLGAYGAFYDTETPNGQTATANASGTIGYAFTWDGGPGNAPPPPAVIKTETCTVQYGVLNGAGSDGNPLAAAGADPPSPAGSAWACTKYSGIDAPGATLTDSLAGAFASARATGPDGGAASAGVFDTVSYSPVSLQLVGPAPDSGGNLDILIGQHCSASIQGIPSALLPYTTYQWSVSGSTFQNWTVSTNAAGQINGMTTFNNGLGVLTNSTAGWCWNDLGPTPTPETVSCTVTVRPPMGHGNPFTVTPSQTVTVYIPNWAALGYGGAMEVSTGIPQGNGTDFWLWAGPIAGTGAGAGMEIGATVSPPVPNPAGFGAGTLELVQLVIPDESYTAYNDFGILSTYTNSENGQEGLDGVYPYPWWQTTPVYEAFDSPGINLTETYAISADMHSQFEDYLMYFPPSCAQCVPVAHFVWSTDGSATIPTTNNWANFVNPAGTVTPSGTNTGFLPDNSFPMWSVVNTGGYF